MNRSWWAKLVLLVVFVVTAIIYVVPTVANLDLEKTRWPFKQKINLGLDLQGGLYMVLGVDFNKVFRDVMERQAQGIQANLKAKGLDVSSVKIVREGFPADDPRIQVIVAAGVKTAEIKNTLKKEYWMLRLTGDQASSLELGLSHEYRAEIREKTISQSIEVIRNRIDEFGVSEPVISSQGSDQIVVELPGIREVQRAKDLIGRTAKLEFKMADDKSIDPARLAQLIGEIEKKNNLTYKAGGRVSDYVSQLNGFAKGQIPEGTEIAFERAPGAPGASEDFTNRIPFLLFSKVAVTGDDLQDASVAIDRENNKPFVSFVLNPRGADLFDKLTAENIGHRLAIVLDGIVHSAPVIQSRIGGGRGQITLGSGQGDQVMKEAKDLSIVLRAGALPAQLEFLEQRVVGPSLGQDSIQKGAMAGVVGCILIFIFMSFYYRMSGIVASVSLTLNALFLLAILIGMEATLTLPGMAGIALTIGMAVDSNVIIFERIRDEIMDGKRVNSAVQAGFQKAFAAIFDANITHGIIAAILMSNGTGPIRGFAITLLIGILTTLFCAVTVCKLFFDGYLGFAKSEIKELSI